MMVRILEGKELVRECQFIKVLIVEVRVGMGVRCTHRKQMGNPGKLKR